MRDRAGRMVFGRGDLIDTSEPIPSEQLGTDDPERVRYEASGWLYLRRALRPGEVRPGVDVFADFGSGKGRVVYQAAARYPFKRVIGVEVAGSLNDIARINIDRNEKQLRCRNVQLVTADATVWKIPDDLTIAYFFSPFTGQAFRTVIDNLVESLERVPRDLRILYVNPVLDDYVRRTGRFELTRHSKGLRRSVRSRWISVWTARPEFSSGPAEGA